MNFQKKNNYIIYFILIFFLILQIILIAHRNSFSIKYFFLFTKKNIGLQDGIKNQKIFDIVTLIKRNNIKYYNLADDLFDPNNKLDKIHHKLYHRVIEASYPSKLNQESNLVISSDENFFVACKLNDKLRTIYVFQC
tara:strand:+ start:772 stop:1182 length:411 start_codon:yes stop_codon:yes gene_type:complete